MEIGFKSGALEVNLARTKQGQAELPPKHGWFVSLSSDYWGINKRTEALFREYNHPHSNYDYIVENLHTISLTDLWLYSSIEQSDEALFFLVSIFEELFSDRKNTPRRRAGIHFSHNAAGDLRCANDLQKRP